MTGELKQLLDRAQADAEAIASRYRQALNADDYHALSLAFYRAESLAEYALEEALRQVPRAKQDELREQIEDEQRHINVFAHWLGSPPQIARPKSKQRPPVVWYSVLLANEIAGFCQFHMLAGLLEATDKRHAIEAIAADERIHIARLVRWLREYQGTTTWGSVVQVTDAFRRRLELRMQQFLPRDELGSIREEMAGAIDRLLIGALESNIAER